MPSQQEPIRPIVPPIASDGPQPNDMPPFDTRPVEDPMAERLGVGSTSCSACTGRSCWRTCAASGG